MPLLKPVQTRNEGDSAFHAVFGELKEGGWICSDVEDYRVSMANKIRSGWSASSNMPSVKKAIEQLIRNKINYPLPADKFPLLSQQQNTYVSGKILGHLPEQMLEEYAKRIETKGMNLLPYELRIIAYAYQKTIALFKDDHISPFKTYNSNPSQARINVYIDGVNRYQAMQKTYKASGLKDTLHGNTYQLKLLMLFLHRGLKNGYEFELATEMDKADKFDDLVLWYQKPGEQAKYRFLQAKHKFNEMKVISYRNLLPETVYQKKGDFSLLKYFISFLKIKNDTAFKNGKLEDFCICTNISLPCGLLEKNQKNISLMNMLEEITTPDPILKNSYNQGVRYKFKQTFYQGNSDEKKEFYKKLRECPSKEKLANALYNTINSHGKILKKQPPFKEWGMYLEENNIIKGKPKKLTEDFLSGTSLSPEVQKFKALYDQKGAASVIPITDKDIDDFLDHFTFAVSQPNDVKLGDIIKEELGSMFNLNDGELIYAAFQRTILDWMKRPEGTFLTHIDIKKFFDEIKQKISKLALRGTTINYLKKLKKVEIGFKPSPLIKEFLQSQSPFLCYKVPKNLLLSSIEILQTLEDLPNYKAEDSYIFIKLKNALLLDDEFKQAFRISRLLILICNNTIEEEGRKLIEYLLGHSTPAQKIIFISADHTIFQEIIPPNKLTLKPAPNIWDTLNDLSKDKIQKRSIIFQGENRRLDKIVINISNILDPEILLRLVEKEIITIGRKPNPTKLTYTSRKFTQRIYINESSLKDIAYCVIDNTDDSGKAGANNISAASFPQQGVSSPSREPYLPITNHSKIHFDKLCKENPSGTVHLLKKDSESSKLIWQQSRGSLAKLRPCLLLEPMEVDTPQTPYIVIAAEPGMGKTTIIEYLAYDWHAKNSDAWIINISLLSTENVIKKTDCTDIDSISDFLMEGATSLEKIIFVECLKSPPHLPKKIALFLDGFDEIQPPQQDKVIELLQTLKGINIGKIVITTRLYAQEKLENALSLFSHRLVPFIKQDMCDFLEKYWKAKLKLTDINSARAQIYINKLIEVFSKSTHEGENTFIGIPLQAKLLAGAFLERFEKFYFGDNNIPDLPEKLGISVLYEGFIEAKYRIMLKNKFELQAYNQLPLIEPSIRKNLEEGQQVLAFNMLFPNESLDIKNISIDESLINVAGIAQVIGENIDFTHRTFAEYFVAKLLIAGLKKSLNDPIRQHCQRILFKYIFKKQHAIIRAFIEEITASDSTELQHTWKNICSHNLSPDILPAYNIFDPNFHNAKIIDPLIIWAATKDKLEQCYQCYQIYSPPSSLSSYFVADLSSLADQKVSHTKSFCKAVLNIKDIEKLSESIKLLHKVKVSNKSFKNLQKTLDTYFKNIYWHYWKICHDQEIPLDIKFPEEVFEKFRNISAYLTDNEEITPDFMEKLTEEKILYLFLKNKLVLDERLFNKLKTSYHDFLRKNIRNPLYLKKEARRLETAYQVLLIKTAQNLSPQQPPLEEKEINNIFKEIVVSSYGRQREELLWLERGGIRMINQFKILTPIIAEKFTKILQEPDEVNRFHDRYAEKVWKKLLLPLLENIDPTSKNGIDYVALINISVDVMQFPSNNLKDFGYIYPNIVQIQNLLKCVEKTLNQPDLSANHLGLCVTQLYLLKKHTPLHFINTSNFLLISDPNSDFEYNLCITYKKIIWELLTYKMMIVVEERKYRTETKELKEFQKYHDENDSETATSEGAFDAKVSELKSDFESKAATHAQEFRRRCAQAILSLQYCRF